MKIIYQGRRIEAEMVNGMSGDLSILPDKYHCGDERILRDTSGRYYLWRRLRRLDDDSSKERQASERTLIHRLSVEAAALWAVARTSPQTRELRQDLDDLLSGFSTPGFSDLNHEARYHLREYVRSRGVDPRDALSGAVIIAFSASGLADDEAVEYARDLRLDEERDTAASGGCTVRFSALDGSDPWEVFLDTEVTEAIDERARAAGQTFGDAVLAMIAKAVTKEPMDITGLDKKAAEMLRQACSKGTSCLRAGEDPRDIVNAAVDFFLCDSDQQDSPVDSTEALQQARARRLAKGQSDLARVLDSGEPLKGLVSDDIYEAAGRYCANHARTVEEAVAEMIKLFAEQAPDDATVNAAADRSDCALCAAAKPAADDDEDDEPLTPDGGDKAA